MGNKDQDRRINRGKCQIHSGSAEEWRCDDCGKNLCSLCVPHASSRFWGASGPRCAICNGDLMWLGIPPVDKPSLLSAAGHCFSYPLHNTVLKFIFLIVGLIFISLALGGFFLFVGLIFTASLVVKYSLAIILCRAQNREAPPSIASIFERDRDYLFLKFIGLVLVLISAQYLISRYNSELALVFSAFITVTIPATLIILAIEKSIRAALNPFTIIRFILKIGWPYGLMWLCLQGVTSGPVYLWEILNSKMHTFILAPVLISSSLYFLFVASCMLGYTVYQFAEELGAISLPNHDGECIDRKLFNRDRALAESKILLDESLPDRARATLRPELDNGPKDWKLRLAYQEILLRLEDQEACFAHCDHCVDLATSQTDYLQIAMICHATILKYPDYRVLDIEHAFNIAQAFQKLGRRQFIAKLLLNIHKLDQNHSRIPEAYLLLARVYSDFLTEDQKALHILDFILEHYPNAENIGAVRQFRATLQYLAP